MWGYWDVRKAFIRIGMLQNGCAKAVEVGHSDANNANEKTDGKASKPSGHRTPSIFRSFKITCLQPPTYIILGTVSEILVKISLPSHGPYIQLLTEYQHVVVWIFSFDKWHHLFQFPLKLEGFNWLFKLKWVCFPLKILFIILCKYSFSLNSLLSIECSLTLTNVLITSRLIKWLLLY